MAGEVTDGSDGSGLDAVLSDAPVTGSGGGGVGSSGTLAAPQQSAPVATFSWPAWASPTSPLGIAVILATVGVAAYFAYPHVAGLFAPRKKGKR